MLSLAILGIDSLTKNPKYPRQVGQSLSAPKSPHHPFRNTCYLEDHRTEFMAYNHGYKSPKYGFGLSGFEMEVMGKRLMAPARSCPLSSESCPNMRMGMLPGM